MTKSFLPLALLAGLLMAAPARADIALPADAFPEGIALAPDGTAYVGSLRQGAVWRASAGAKAAEPFIPAGSNGLVSAVGLLADAARGLLWVCSSDPGVSPRTGSAPPAVLAFDLAGGMPKARYELPGGGFCNDMALGPDGSLYVTDSLNPRILRLPPGGQQLEDWLVHEAFRGEGFSLNGLDFGADSQLYAVRYNSGQMFRIDPARRTVAEIALPRPLAQADGLKRMDGARFAVVEGGRGGATLVTIDGNRASLSPLSDGLKTPTTLAVQGQRLLLVEGQLDLLFDPSKKGQAPGPFRVVEQEMR